MIEINDETGEVKFNMKARSAFFASVLTYSAFSPVPDEAIDILGTNPIVNAATYGKSYKTIYNSGAYYVSNFKPMTNITLRANPNYRNKEKIYIKNLVFSYSSKKSSSAPRLEWEVGDRSETRISSTDEAGWNKYIGKNTAKPNFMGAHMFDSPIRFTYVLHYNYARVNANNPVPEDNPINQAMAQHSTRALISYALNRKYFLDYFTNSIPLLPGSKASPFTFNRYVPNNLIKFSENSGRGFDNSKNVEAAQQQGINDPDKEVVKEWVTDYAELYDNQYLLKIAKPIADDLRPGETFDAASEVNKLNLGYDAHLQNDLLAFSALTSEALKNEFKQAKTYEEKIQILIKQVNEDYASYGKNGGKSIPFNSNNKANISWLVPAGSETTTHPFLLDMTRRFSDIPNNPLNIELNVAANLEEYRALLRNKDFSIFIGGWGPDYADPTTFLNTIKYDGDLSEYNNGKSVIDQVNDSDGNVAYKGKNTYFDQLASYFADYEKGLDDASLELGYERFNKLAEQEVNLIYKYKLFYPAYIESPVVEPFLTYRNRFTNQTTEIGTSKAKFFGQKMIPRLWTNAEYQEALKAYNDGRGKTIIYNWYEDQKNVKIS